MSIDSLQRKVESLNKEISALTKEQNRYLEDAQKAAEKVLKAKKQASTTKSKSTYNTKMREIERESKKQQDASGKANAKGKRILDKQKELQKVESQLAKEKAKRDNQIIRQTNTSINKLDVELDYQRGQQNIMMQEIQKLKEAKDKITILFIASNPMISVTTPQGVVNMPKLDLDFEAREIKEAITKSLNRDSIQFETRWAARTTDLFQAINETNPTIIHFSGHGSDDGGLVFQDNAGLPKVVKRETVIEMINASSDQVRLVVFNNCYSSAIADKVVEEVEAAIGMNTSIGDQAAIVFATQLYSSLGFGKNLEMAFKQAIIAIKLEGIDEAETPELFVNSSFNATDIVLVKNKW